MLDSGIIVPSTSQWGSPCLLVTKKDGSKRFCIDFRKLNSVSKKINYPLPLLTDVWDSLSSKKSSIFSTLDLKSGYFQVPIKKESQEKTTFVVQDGAYQFTRTPFGCQGSGGHFQLVMSDVLKGMTYRDVIVYVDDILVYNANFDDHLKSLKEVFDRLRKANMRLNGKKCSFGIPEITYLGHKISGEGIRMDDSKIEVVKKWAIPTTVKHIRAFLGLTNYFRRFVRNYARLALPLNNLLRKDVKFKWDEKCQNSFEALKTALMTAPILVLPNMEKEFILSVDASGESIGYILSQIGDDQKEHAITYGGRSLRNAEKQWTVTEQEGLSLVEAIRANYQYLYNKEFVVYSDHLSLKFLNQIKRSKGRLYRWSLALEGLSMKVIHRAGRLNRNADGLSRKEYPEELEMETEHKYIDDDFELANINEIPEDEDCEVDIGDGIMGEHDSGDEIREKTVIHFKYEQPEVKRINILEVSEEIMSIDNLQQLQRDCPELGRIIRYMQESELPLDNKMARRTVFEAEEYFFRDGVLMHHYSPRNKYKRNLDPVIEQLAVPSALKTKILGQFHEKNGHAGFDRTFSSMRPHYFWRTMYQDTLSYVKSCEICQQSKKTDASKEKPHG